MPDGTKLTAWINGSRFMVEALGTQYSVAEIGEQLAWLGAALRSSPYEHGVAYSMPLVSCRPACFVTTGGILIDNPPHLMSKTVSWVSVPCKIGFIVKEKEEDLEDANGQCWHNMFRNPVVVKGYPIQRKSKLNTGLEIPLNMMAGLARAQRANNFNGKLFIKGFSTMLIPTRHSGGLLFWHLLYNKDGNRISYLENTVPHAENVNASDLEKARHVVGWCSNVRNYAGR